VGSEQADVGLQLYIMIFLKFSLSENIEKWVLWTFYLSKYVLFDHKLDLGYSMV